MLTSYWARHSWATIASELDIANETIAEALGHEYGNRITNIYIRKNQKKVDIANRKVLDWVLYGKIDGKIVVKPERQSSSVLTAKGLLPSALSGKSGS